MTRWFADSYFWLAYLNPGDAAHHLAEDWLERVQGKIVTSESVLLEVADAMSHPKNRTAVVEFLRLLRTDSDVEVVDHNREGFDAGLELFAARPDKKWSLTDCISFALMTRLGLTEALTGDHHFEQAGFVALLK